METEKNKKAEEFVKKMQEEKFKSLELTTKYRVEQNDLEVKSVQ